MNDKAYLSAYELCQRILAQQPNAFSQHIIESLTTSLENAKHYLQAGYLIKSSDPIRALSLFRRGKQYSEAIVLARTSQMNECVFIEKEWAEHLFSTGHY